MEDSPLKKEVQRSNLHDYDKELSAAFQADCEEFLTEFGKLQSFKFSDFAQVWQQQKFTNVFAGQGFALLLRDFCENCFYNVKKYIVFPKNIYIQLGAFYMLYGLYHKQPLKHWVKIRLTSEEYQKISELSEAMKLRKEYDAVYIFAKMKVEEAFLYVTLRKPLGPEERFVKSFEAYYDNTFESAEMNTTLSEFYGIASSDVVQNLEKTNEEYQELLQTCSGKIRSLTPFASTLVKDIKDACRNFQEEITTESRNKIESCTGKPSISASRRIIKKRAMANKNAVYRASKKVKTAQDEDMLDTEEPSDSDE